MTSSVIEDDYDLAHYTFDGAAWQSVTLPPAYNRSGVFLSDGWPTFDRARRELYFEHGDTAGAFIVRARLDASGAVPPAFEPLAQLGDDVGDPDLSPDGLRMYTGSRRRAGTDNDIYMFERSCD